MSHEVEGMFSVRLRPWHGLGNILQEHPTSEEALTASGLDWEVVPRELWWQNGDGMKKVKGRVGLIRQVFPDPAVCDPADIGRPAEDLLSVVSNDYKVLQNKSAFSIFDPLVKEGKLVYETAGSLFNGRKVWILARYVDDKITVLENDDVRPYLLLLNGHDGETGVVVQPTPIRVVCNNTLSMSLSCGSIFSFRHAGDVERYTERAMTTVVQLRESFNRQAESWKKFTETQIGSNATISLITKVLWPQSAEIEEEKLISKIELAPRKQNTIDQSIGKIIYLMTHGYGAGPAISGTVWGVYNALVEFAEYFMGLRARDRGNYQLFGEAAAFKRRAFDACVEYVCSVEESDALLSEESE